MTKNEMISEVMTMYCNLNNMECFPKIHESTLVEANKRFMDIRRLSLERVKKTDIQEVHIAFKKLEDELSN